VSRPPFNTLFSISPSPCTLSSPTKIAPYPCIHVINLKKGLVKIGHSKRITFRDERYTFRQPGSISSKFIYRTKERRNEVGRSNRKKMNDWQAVVISEAWPILLDYRFSHVGINLKVY
jgi:hypothetical protein